MLLWALKPAEEGAEQGLIARVWNVSEAPKSATLALPGTGIALARSTTHLETDLDVAPLATGALPIELERQQLRTFRLFPSGTAGVETPATSAGAALSIRPNPARLAGPGATVAFAQSRPGPARLTIVDVTGARVATLLDGGRSAGRHEVRWEPGREGRAVRPGLYFVRLETPDGTFSGRLVLLER